MIVYEQYNYSISNNISKVSIYACRYSQKIQFRDLFSNLNDLHMRSSTISSGLFRVQRIIRTINVPLRIKTVRRTFGRNGSWRCDQKRSRESYINDLTTIVVSF